MQTSRSLLRSQPGRFGIAAAAVTALVGAGMTAMATSSTGPSHANDVRWLASEHAAPPFGTERPAPHLGSTPRARCGPGSRPETGRQGRVPAADFASGRAAKGYICNTSLVGHFGQSGGYRVERYVDKAGHECAFYDSTLLFPSDAPNGEPTGTYVLDMKNPRKPVRTAVLQTPAMQTPHESLRLNQKRGLLVADAGSPATQVGFVDVWDASKDCRHPVFESSLPIGPLGHESGFAPDGKTFYATATAREGITAIDLTDPAFPSIVWHTETWGSHGMSISADGNRAYLAAPCCDYVSATSNGSGGLIILDLSEVQARKPNPQVYEISRLTWPEVSIPQNTIPVTIKGRKYLIEFDEFASNVFQYNPDSRVGAARIIDISDETNPRMISRIRLAVHEPGARATNQQDDPGAQTGTQGYAAHYCSVPRQVNPGIVACSMILSGLRIFDIRDPYHPREVAYFNRPPSGGAHAMSAPTFVPSRGEIWYTDGASGFWNVRVTNGAWPRRGPSRLRR
jgi:hypothetical protein